ncbi:hypothetical protein LTR66_000276 [Elasticomyces elasticus]|nr:hypothetical protein LTR66_000276 [Elasticomyces elasticus]
MDAMHALDNDAHNPLEPGTPRDTVIQIGLSVALGVGAFLTFCVLRPRWSGLYAARKQQIGAATALPQLPDTLFGWIPALWKITDQQVLASAGLDAYVFLAFFKMAIKFLTVTLFFSLTVIKPVHDSFPENHVNGTMNDTSTTMFGSRRAIKLHGLHALVSVVPEDFETDYLWMYLVFAYLFTFVATYLIVSETRKMIEIRQEYLGSQTTVTDRTIRLSGIPPELRSEEKIKEFVEELGIGKVEAVMLCRQWRELDDTMLERMDTLRRLEEAWTVYTGERTVERTLETLPIVQPDPPGPTVEGEEDDDHENTALLGVNGHGSAREAPYGRVRPKTTIRFGRFKLQSKVVDAIDYYENKLHKVDQRIKGLRQREFQPTPLAFVTMDSVASCQMAVQAVLDPSPLQLLAGLSPAPSDVVWRNTYLSRQNRMVRAWSITAFILVLTVFWTVILVPVAGALNTDAIRKVFPQLANVLDDHPIIRSLVNTQLPTLLVALLNVAVPYLYDLLSNLQGMISQGDVELSVISKNFFFTFFNFFVVFTVLGTASNFFEEIGDSLKDTTKIAYTLARSLQKLLSFYANYIILQGLGLFPFRLLQFGSVSMYPISRIGAKTPRDYAELVQPATFSYGFYLPQTILIFIICTVYSVLRESWKVLLSGLAYFMIGSFVYKYQLLYAMDHRQHSTGRGWIMICDRIMIGLIVFQFTTAGQLALKGAVKRSILVVPLLMGTVWFAYIYTRTYRPLMKFIALRSIRQAEQTDYVRPVEDDDNNDEEGLQRYDTETRHGQTVDESRETGLRFINPSLIAPLEDVWIANKSAQRNARIGDDAASDENPWGEENV